MRYGKFGPIHVFILLLLVLIPWVLVTVNSNNTNSSQGGATSQSPHRTPVVVEYPTVVVPQATADAMETAFAETDKPAANWTPNPTKVAAGKLAALRISLMETK